SRSRLRIAGVESGFAQCGVRLVNRLRDVQIKLFSGWNADIKPIALNRIVDLLRVSSQYAFRALNRSVAQRRGFGVPKNGLLPFGQQTSRSAQESGREQFDFREVIGFDEPAPESGAAVSDAPAIAVRIGFPVEGDAGEGKLLARFPNQGPAVATGNAFAGAVGLGCAMNLCSGR